jgi:hypothetical protein
MVNEALHPAGATPEARPGRDAGGASTKRKASRNIVPSST